MGHGKGIVIRIARHTDHEVDVHTLQHRLGLFDGAHLTECGRIAQSQLHVLAINLLVDASIILQHKGIIGICHDENVVDASFHQVDEGHIFEQDVIPLLWDFAVHAELIFQK